MSAGLHLLMVGFSMLISEVLSPDSAMQAGKCFGPAYCVDDKGIGFATWRQSWPPIEHAQCRNSSNAINGVKGQPGKVGADGAKGEKGETGLNRSGQKGEPGFNGTDGATGPRGALGPKGPLGTAGVNGSKGSKGAMGFSVLNNTIIRELVGELFPQYYNGKFYTAVLGHLNTAEGSKKCRNLGGDLANIYDLTHMEKIMAYLRQYKLGGSKNKWYWLGMTYNATSGGVFSRDGTKVPDENFRWRPRGPNSNPSYTYMRLLVNRNATDKEQYLVNYYNVRHSILCEL